MIEVIRADITTLHVDAIVNAANSALAGGGGVDGAIHRAAGPELARASMAHGRCAPGDAVITPGFRLPARFVIHAVGPVWMGGDHEEAATLRRAYERSFALASAEGSIRSIAFPAISTGVYRFPKRDAAAIATAAMRAHEHEFDRIVACLFDDENVRLYRDALHAAIDLASTVDPRFLGLIDAFRNATASALAAVLERTGLTHPFDRLRAGVPRQATLEGDPALTYEFHGGGLRVQVWGREVDFDFGFDGRAGGFNAWSLTRFAELGTEEYPEYREARTVERQLALAVVAGIVVQPFRDRQDDLYYLASDVARGA